MVAHVHSSERLNAPAEGTVHVVIDGLDQAGPSFEARVFVDNEHADELTPTTPEFGYAGSINVYGLGVPSESPGEPPPKLPMSRSLAVTDAVDRGGRSEGGFAVTVVAVPYSELVTPQQAGLTLDLDRIYVAEDDPAQ